MFLNATEFVQPHVHMPPDDEQVLEFMTIGTQIDDFPHQAIAHVLMQRVIRESALKRYVESVTRTKVETLDPHAQENFMKALTSKLSTHYLEKIPLLAMTVKKLLPDANLRQFERGAALLSDFYRKRHDIQ